MQRLSTRCLHTTRMLRHCSSQPASATSQSSRADITAIHQRLAGLQGQVDTLKQQQMSTAVTATAAMGLGAMMLWYSLIFRR